MLLKEQNITKENGGMYGKDGRSANAKNPFKYNPAGKREPGNHRRDGKINF
jgi:hypothetical protein